MICSCKTSSKKTRPENAFARGRKACYAGFVLTVANGFEIRPHSWTSSISHFCAWGPARHWSLFWIYHIQYLVNQIHDRIQIPHGFNLPFHQLSYHHDYSCHDQNSYQKKAPVSASLVPVRLGYGEEERA